MSNAIAESYIRRRAVGLGLADNLGAARAAAEGVAYQHQPYENGAAGVRRSLTEMARLMREARNDKDVNGYAGDVLKAAGLDGRNRSSWTARNVAQVMLDNVRSVTVYTPDPNGTEMIVSPAGQLCLRPGLCIRRGDCDDHSVLLGSLLMCVGFHVRIVKQSWGPDQQEHVLVAVQDESGNWLKCDPSHASLPAGRGVAAKSDGRGVAAKSEEFYDPMDANASINVGTGAEIVTFGALPGVGRGGGGGHGGGSHGGGHGGGHHGGGHGGYARRWHGNRWWDWDGATWVVVANTCTQWGAPIIPPTSLLAEAQTQLGYSGNQPVSETWSDGITYLFSMENGHATVRPCASAGFAGHSINGQLGPSEYRVPGRDRRLTGAPGVGRAVGLGATTATNVRALGEQTSSLMDLTDAAVQKYAAQMSKSDVQDWNGKYASWRNLVPSAHTSCSPAGPNDWIPPTVQCQATFGYWWGDAADTMRGYKVDAYNTQKLVHDAAPSFMPTKPSSDPVPAPGTPGAPGSRTWIDDVKTAGLVVGGVIVVGALAYITTEVVGAVTEARGAVAVARKATGR